MHMIHIVYIVFAFIKKKHIFAVVSTDCLIFLYRSLAWANKMLTGHSKHWEMIKSEKISKPNL